MNNSLPSRDPPAHYVTSSVECNVLLLLVNRLEPQSIPTSQDQQSPYPRACKPTGAPFRHADDPLAEMLRVTSSRRAAGLKSTDYDHEISLVDHDAARTPTEPQTPEQDNMTRSSTRQQLLSPNGEHSRRTPSPSPRQDDERTEDGQESPRNKNQDDEELRPPPLIRPSIEVQGKHSHFHTSLGA